MAAHIDHYGWPTDRLAAAAARGDEEAYRALYERYHNRLLAALRASLPAETAEEAAQEAWARAVEQVGSLRAARGVLFLAADNRPQLRGQHSRHFNGVAIVRLENFDAIPSAPSDDPVVELESREVHESAERAIARLPYSQRRALRLSSLGGRTRRETARLLGISISGIESLLHRARANFQRNFSADESGVDRRWSATRCRAPCGSCLPGR